MNKLNRNAKKCKEKKSLNLYERALDQNAHLNTYMYILYCITSLSTPDITPVHKYYYSIKLNKTYKCGVELYL